MRRVTKKVKYDVLKDKFDKNLSDKALVRYSNPDLELKALTIKEWYKDKSLLQEFMSRYKKEYPDRVLPISFVCHWLAYTNTNPSTVYDESQGALALGPGGYYDLSELDLGEHTIPEEDQTHLKFMTIDIVVSALEEGTNSNLTNPIKVFKFLCARYMVMPENKAILFIGNKDTYRRFKERIDKPLYQLLFNYSQEASIKGQLDLHKGIVFGDSKRGANKLNLLKALDNDYSQKQTVKQDIDIHVDAGLKTLPDDELDRLLLED